MSDLSPGAVRRAIDDLSIEIARLKLEVKAKKNARRALRKLLRKARAKESTAASVSEPRKGKPEPGKDASRTVPQASHADIRVEGTSGGSDPSRTTGGSHQQPALRTGVASGVVDTPSPEVAASRARKPSPETSEAEPVRQAGGNARPGSLLSRVRTYMEEHPDATAPECAAALGSTTAKVRNTSAGAISFRSSRGPSLREQIAPVNAAHPEWSARQIAEHLGLNLNSVSTILALIRGEASRQSAENASRPFIAPEASEQPEPANARHELPVARAEASAASGNPLRDKVHKMVRFHPNWTARMIAQRLGYPLASVQGHYDDARAAALAAAPLPDMSEGAGV